MLDRATNCISYAYRLVYAVVGGDINDENGDNMNVYIPTASIYDMVSVSKEEEYIKPPLPPFLYLFLYRACVEEQKYKAQQKWVYVVPA